ncbi:MAG: DNA translocase FtsK [Clostridia bacterium]|nr:DNA translocase FtsK [Clostridia bacterium]
MAAKRKYKKRTKKTQSIDLMTLGTVIFSIIIAVLVYTKSGYVGESISDLLGGMIGWLKYILPVGTLIITIKVSSSKTEMLGEKLAKYFLLLICIATLISSFEFGNGKLDVKDNLQVVAQNAYNLGKENAGGGALGALASVPLIKLFGKLGATIVSIILSIILFAITFEINLSEKLGVLLEQYAEKREEIQEERIQRREQLQDERRAEKEQAKDKRNRIREEKRIAREIALDETEDEQIKINLNGAVLDENHEEPKKFTQKVSEMLKNDSETNKNVETSSPDVIESNLFKQEEEKKEEKTKEVLQLEHTLTVEDENYEYPPLTLLSLGQKKTLKGGAKALTDTAAKLQRTLHSFGVSAKVENVSVGPAITRYELKPAEGVRVSKIANLADDIALNLAAETIRIEAPIPGKQAVGIEVPNKEKVSVHLRDVLESDNFLNSESKLSVALGKDIAGQAVIADIAKMPHVLIAGSTGSGKSVCINTLITSIIFNSKPSEVKLVMVDPKVVELSVYNGIPHLLIPVVTDPRKAAGALAWAVQEMDNRYTLFASRGVRDLQGYNNAVEKEGGTAKIPQIVVIIDELADLMMVAAKEVEESICRLAQKARAAGMHLVIATQRPSVDVITGLIKANVPSRIAFAVSSQIDSRTILDSTGAEKLLGKGDMLFFPAGAPKPTRVQGAFVSDGEVEKIVDFIKSNGTATYSEDILESIENSNKTEKELAEDAQDDDTDPLLMEAIDLVVETGQASTSFIQRKLKVGYARAGRIIDQMEERGIISGYQGSKPRQVLMGMEKLQELKMSTSETTTETE